MAKRQTSSSKKRSASKTRSYAAARKSRGRGRSKTTKKKRSARKKRSGLQKLADSVVSGQTLGVVMALTGVFTLLALLSSQRGAVTAWWIDMMSLLFGVGVYFLPVVLLVSGVFIFLYSQGYRGWFTPVRFFGFLLFWGTMQALIHLVGVTRHADLASPRPGDVGGLTGWWLTQSLLAALGPFLTGVITLACMAVGVILMFGVRWQTLQAVSLTAMTAAFAALVGLVDQLRGRGPSLAASLRSGWRRFLLWMQSLRRTSAQAPPAPQPVLDPNGVVSTLPPDNQSILQEPPSDPMVRIVGAEDTDWRLPRIEDILEPGASGEITEEDLAERARIIEDTLNAFGVPVTVVEVNKGPVVTQFGVKPGYVTRKVRGEEKRMKVRVSKIQALANDISLALAASPIRIEAPVPGRDIVGIEVPNQAISMVTLRSILESEEFTALKAPLKIALGQDVSGRAVAATLARMPHLLIAGATGSGKSVCVNAIICSLLFQYTPDDLRFILVDPKRVELTTYNGIPHLIDNVITDVETVVAVLGWAVREMETRYKKLEKEGARNIEAYNARMIAEGKPKMPYTVIVIDELADIMMMSPDEVEKLLVRLAQMARAVGIHLVVATQRPSVNVVTGLIKANFPSRIAFAVTSQVDSRVILDTPGAEKLLGRGDMLFMRPDSAKLARLQGAFVSDAEVHRLVRYWRGQRGLSAEPASELAVEPAIQRSLWEDMVEKEETQSRRDPLYDEAMAVVQEAGRASVSLLQRRLQIGYTRAARLIDMMEADGIVGPDLGGGRGREVLIGQPSAPEPTPSPPPAPTPTYPEPSPQLDDAPEPPPWEDLDSDAWEDPSEPNQFG
ncbi:MAG TPA: DNA translocase FtsK [Caldilineae bacterium]|nr:DNA translocase FtsK [Caldilineae bacterium]